MYLSKTQRNMQRVSKTACLYKSKLKRNPTKAEIIFRQILKEHQIPFSFQRIIYTPNKFFIVDFIIRMKPFKIIEIDGKYHQDNQEYDKMREAKISKTRYRKYKFIRISNEEIFNGQALIILKSLYKRKFKNAAGKTSKVEKID